MRTSPRGRRLSGSRVCPGTEFSQRHCGRLVRDHPRSPGGWFAADFGCDGEGAKSRLRLSWYPWRRPRCCTRCTWRAPELRRNQLVPIARPGGAVNWVCSSICWLGTISGTAFCLSLRARGRFKAVSPCGLLQSVAGIVQAAWLEHRQDMEIDDSGRAVPFAARPLHVDAAG